MVGDCGHDLVGFVGLIWWVSIVLSDGIDGVEIGVVGSRFCGGGNGGFFFFFFFFFSFFDVVFGSGFGLA